MIVFGIRCKFFIVLRTRMKTCRSNIFFCFVQGKRCAPDRHRVRNLSSPGLCSVRLGSHQCDNCHRSGFFGAIIFIPLMGTSE